ncbi:MAG: glycosyl hydrolase 2 galactose-binding domain-containing protein [Oscillospiraceae bacterium]
MKKIDLNSGWTLKYDGKDYPASLPCSLYDTLINNGVIDDPYYRENEYISTPLCDKDCALELRFPAETPAECKKAFLRLERLDTLADIYLNEVHIGNADNFHRTWEFDVTETLRPGENILRVEIHSPTKFIAKKNAEYALTGVEHCMEGYQYIRKPHYMFGWDWGTKLPDMGIAGSVSLEFYEAARINNVYYEQEHNNDSVKLTCRVKCDIFDEEQAKELNISSTITAPNGKENGIDMFCGKGVTVIKNPMLWWVRGLGDQPLYECKVKLMLGEKVIDSYTKRIGLRTLTISQEEDKYGKEFCFVNNGVKVFAMGGNLIPEDQILPRCTHERTKKLLDDCAKANFNFIRVWGGGLYPDSYFYELCDEMGFIVWQDFMFACSEYLLTNEFEQTVREEVRDNIIRIRNHPSLGMWCGNNEIESAWEYWGWKDDKRAKDDYLRLFENIIPSIVKALDPQTFYWPSSPSSGGGIKNSSDDRAGDMHYWDVWHNFKPIEDFRKYYYRFCSEYGFESLPDIKTCKYFADESKGDLDLCGNVMQTHQKCTFGNEKLMYYLAQMVNYPYDFRRLIYCTQLVQAECIRSNVEHMRRAAGRCMGSAYWQINDSNPVISWSSIDYFGRWKALHYFARRFYAPVLISCDDTIPTKPTLYIHTCCNEIVIFTVKCDLRDNYGRVLKSYESEAFFDCSQARAVMTLDLTDELSARSDKRSKYLEYSVYDETDTLVSCGTTMFVRYKEFDFIKPDITFEIKDCADSFAITVRSDVFAACVCLSLDGFDAQFSDNWFDLHPDKPVTVLLEKCGGVENLTAEDILRRMNVESY